MFISIFIQMTENAQLLAFIQMDQMVYRCRKTTPLYGLWSHNISHLNSKTNLSPTSDFLANPTTNDFTISQWIATAEKSGNIVTLNFNISGEMKATSDIILLTNLPKKYSPATNHYHSYCTQEGNFMAMFIYTDGRLTLFNGNKSISGFFLRQTISYPVPWKYFIQIARDAKR